MSRPSSDAEMAAFFNLSLDLLAVLDCEGHIVLANQPLVRMMGQQADALHGQRLSTLIHPADYVPSIHTIHAALPTPHSFICRHRAHDHSLIWVMWTIYDGDGDRFRAVGRDITPYKEMEAKEAERNIFAEAMLDTVLAINSSLSLEQVLKRILSNVGKVVSYDYVNIMLVEGKHAVVAGVQHRGDTPPTTPLRDAQFLIADHPYLQTLYTTQESLIVSELKTVPHWMAPDDTLCCGAFLGTPIVVEDTVIGFVAVFNQHAEYFTPLHAQQLLTFANQAGIALKNARLYTQSQHVAVLRERQRMAQELHDSVNQHLFAASTYAELLPKALERQPDVVSQYARDIRHLIQSALAQMRMILIELHPDALVKTSLAVILKQLCEAFTRQTGITVDFRANVQAQLVAEEQIAVYRIAQESLHNIEKHAQATQVYVHVQVDAGGLSLYIADDGVGFHRDGITELQFGVKGIEERAHGIGATITIDSIIDKGTEIRLSKSYE